MLPAESVPLTAWGFGRAEDEPARLDPLPRFLTPRR